MEGAKSHARQHYSLNDKILRQISNTLLQRTVSLLVASHYAILKTGNSMIQNTPQKKKKRKTSRQTSRTYTCINASACRRPSHQQLMFSRLDNSKRGQRRATSGAPMFPNDFRLMSKSDGPSRGYPAVAGMRSKGSSFLGCMSPCVRLHAEIPTESRRTGGRHRHGRSRTLARHRQADPLYPLRPRRTHLDHS